MLSPVFHFCKWNSLVIRQRLVAFHRIMLITIIILFATLKLLLLLLISLVWYWSPLVVNKFGFDCMINDCFHIFIGPINIFIPSRLPTTSVSFYWKNIAKAIHHRHTPERWRRRDCANLSAPTNNVVNINNSKIIRKCLIDCLPRQEFYYFITRVTLYHCCCQSVLILSLLVNNTISLGSPSSERDDLTRDYVEIKSPLQGIRIYVQFSVIKPIKCDPWGDLTSWSPAQQRLLCIEFTPPILPPW